MHTYCPRCGKWVPEKGNFCPSCGTDIGAVREEAGREAGAAPATTVPSPFGSRSVEAAAGDAAAAAVRPTVTHTLGPVLTFRDKAERLVDKGNDFFREKRYWRAIQCYDRAIDIDPDFDRAWNNKGLTLTKLGKLEEAKACILHIERIRAGVVTGSRVRPDPDEEYIGGLSSVSLKRRQEGVFAGFSGAIGSNVGGYGIYVTNRRLFIIKDAKKDVTHPRGPGFATFLKDEIFGGDIDVSGKSIRELEIGKLQEMHRDEIGSIVLKPPGALSGSITITSIMRSVITVYIDHSREFRLVEALMKEFLPDKVRYTG